MSVRLNVGVLIFDDVEVLDFAGPYEVFSRTRLEPGVASRRADDSAPFRVFTVAKSTEPVAATGGLTLVPDFSFRDAPPVELLVVPGGFGTRRLLDDPVTLDWVRHVASVAQHVTSVCTGALLLAKSGLLDGKRATTHWGALDLLASFPGVEVARDRRVVDDGIVTSAGVASGMDMAFYMVERLFGAEVADETAHYIEFRRSGEEPHGAPV